MQMQEYTNDEIIENFRISLIPTNCIFSSFPYCLDEMSRSFPSSFYNYASLYAKYIQFVNCM